MLSQNDGAAPGRIPPDLVLFRYLRVSSITTSSLRPFPLHASHAWIGYSTHILADPTSFEEPLLDTTVSVVIDDHGGLTSVMQLGLGILGNTDDVLTRCIDAAKLCWAQARKDVYGTS